MFVHIGHLLKIKKSSASKFLVILAILSILSAIVLALLYTSTHIPNVGYYIVGGFILAFFIEIALRLITKRVIKPQSKESIFKEIKESLKKI
jgi:asparagine N-glycosylation enzyme membrane subunit Stt3